jgi:hypothetical protein
MSEVFRSKMAQRVTWMLAEYLDTPVKVASAMRATLAASSSLHGQALGNDVLGHATSSSLRLEERAPENSTEWFAYGDGSLDGASSNEASAFDGTVGDKESAPLSKIKKQNKRDKGNQRDDGTDDGNVLDDAMMDVDVAEAAS